MSSTIWHITMSLDGFIAGPNDSMDWAIREWSDDGTNTRDIEVDRSSIADDVLRSAGAILGGHLAPVLLGDGVRLYESIDTAPIALTLTAVAAADQVTDLRFRV